MSVACYKCGGEAQRVPETLDTFVDSSWYFLRFADPHNQEAAFDPVVANQWMPVDIYVGGAEHTVLHLMYSRFITKVLRDLGYITADEPFQKLRHQGMILGPDHQKMSKSKGNVVNPDELVAQFGADAVRMQLAFLGPYDQGGPWQLTGIHGVSRFLNRAWQEQYRRNKAGWAKSTDDDVARALAQAAIKIGNDISEFKFNTAIAELMKVLNTVTKAENVSESSWKSFIIILAPFAPFISEELWHLIGNNDSIHNQAWPDLEISQKQSGEKSDISVQVNGKFRAIVQVSADQSVDTIIAKAQQDERISRHTDGKRVIKHIYIPGKVLNLVVQ
jgi:leucyl-tRNA synthetase